MGFFTKEDGKSIKGILRVPAVNAINTSANVQEAAKISVSQNSASYLRANFGNKDKCLLYEETPSGVLITVLPPTAPYSEKSVLISALDNTKLNEEYTKTHTIYDCPPDAQEAYWTYGMTILRQMHEHALQANEPHAAILLENCIRHATSIKQRTSRSISIPHMHAILVNLNHIDEQDFSIDHLGPELRSTHLFLQSELFQEAFTSLAEQFLDILEPAQRMQSRAVHGYTFIFKPNISAARFTEFMAEHHRTYTEISLSIIRQLRQPNRARVIYQPSYRMYMHYEPENNSVDLDSYHLEVDFCPESMSYAGVMESMDIALERSSAQQPRVTEYERMTFFQEIIACAPMRV